MRSPTNRTLRIVPFNPSDYSLAEVLSKEDQSLTENMRDISAALSLYFQWEPYRSSLVYPDYKSKTKGVPCSMDYDRDERTPTEISIIIKKEAFSNFAQTQFQKLAIRFEVFRTCYEFEASALSPPEIFNDDYFRIIITPPRALKTFKSRRLPRIEMTSILKEKLPKTTWNQAIDGQNNEIDVTIEEMGLKSIKVKCSQRLGKAFGKLKMGDFEIPAEATPTPEGDSILLFNFENNESFGRYFDVYRLLAYPSLSPRSSFSADAIIQLYQMSNYFGKFEGEKSNEQIRDIKSNWKDLETAQHLTTADYVARDDDGAPFGASSVALSFYNDDRPVWVFHQLCSMKIEKYVYLTGQLYMWRAEYLAARPEPLEIAVWFHSRSRWLERIYVKYSMQTNYNSNVLYPIIDRRCTFEPNTNDSSIKLREYCVGTARRICTTSSPVWAAAGPRFLNANENLDCIVALWGNPTSAQIKVHGETISSRLTGAPTTILVTVPHDFNINELGGAPQLSDRFCHFKKNQLIDLLASVEHSIAVTTRKFNNA